MQNNNKPDFDQWVDSMITEAKARLNWYIGGIGIHCLSPEIFSKMPTERIVELYNVEMEFFRPTK